MNEEKCSDPDAAIENCVVCKKSIHTCERQTPVNNDYRCPVHKDGFENNNGNWFCSSECFDKYE